MSVSEDPTPEDARIAKARAIESDAVSRLASMAADARAVTLNLKVSDRSSGLKMYGFAYDGAPVLMANHEGQFEAIPDKGGLLEWAMLGDPGSTMKVEVKRGDRIIAKRDQSKIDPPD
ncbi:MAG: hypothetical protein ABJF50_18620, partial [Paracoccaceae bacterium]